MLPYIIWVYVCYQSASDLPRLTVDNVSADFGSDRSMISGYCRLFPLLREDMAALPLASVRWYAVQLLSEN